MAAISHSARVTNATINDQLKELTEPGKIKNVLLKLLASWGAIKYNCSGLKVDWRVLFNETEPDEYQDGDPVSSPRITRHRTAEVEWYAWVKSESFGELEKLINKGKPALYDLVAKAMSGQVRDFTKFLGRMPYTDGDSTTDKSIDGLDTMTSDISASTGTAALGHTGTPKGSYAGLSMVLNAFGSGSWSTGDVWPVGRGLLPYYFWSPIVADITADWGQSANDWKSNWRLGLNHIRTHTEAIHGVLPKAFVTTPLWLAQAQNSLIDKERIAVDESGNKLVNLGFNILHWNGINIVSDWQCTQNVCYGLNPDHMEMRNVLSQMLRKKGDEDITILTEIVQFLSLCNMRFETPGYFPAVREIT